MSNEDSAFARTLITILLALFIFMVAIIIAAQWVTDDSELAQDDRVKAKVEEEIKPVAQVNTEATAAEAPAGGSFDAEGTYKASCGVCHDSGAAGAPKLGDKAAWSDRLSGGKDAVYANGINGKGAMPAKGNAPVSDDEFKQVVDYIISKSS